MSAGRSRPTELAQFAAETGAGERAEVDYRVAHTTRLLPALSLMTGSAPASPLLPGRRLPLGNVSMFAAAGLAASVCSWPSTVGPGPDEVDAPHTTDDGRFRAARTVLNPGFLPDALSQVELLLTLGKPPWNPSLRDCLMLTRMTSLLVDLAARAGSILFLHSPVAPVVDLPKSLRGDGSGEMTRDPQGPCIRLGVGLEGHGPGRRAVEGPGALSRLGFEDAVARLAVENGLGLKLADRRVDRVRGEWFTIRRFDRDRYRAARDAEFAEVSAQAPRRAVVLTVVGPARAGMTRTVVSSLRHRGVGLLAMSTTELQGVGFDSLFLPVAQPGAAGPFDDSLGWSEGMAAIGRLCGIATPQADHPEEHLPDGYALMVSELMACRFPHTSRQTGAAKDGRTPYPLWVSWDTPAHELDTASVITALTASLTARTASHELLYAHSRLVGQDRVRGRAKCSIVLGGSGPDGGVQRSLHTLAATVEEHVLAALRSESRSGAPSLRVRVSSQERWLVSRDSQT